MKQFIYLIAFTLAAVAFTGCSESETDSNALSLSASRPSISANGSDQTLFTVKKNGAAIEDATIYLITVDGSKKETPLDSYKFSTANAGTYVFEAHYDGEVSNRVTVKAQLAQTTASKYYRKACVFKLTGTWCAFCPTAGLQIEDLSNRVFPDRIVQMAFHGLGSASEEPMLVPETDLIYKQFKLEGYPSAVIDLRVATDADIFGITRQQVNESIKTYPAKCGIRIESKVSGGNLEITAGVTAEIAGEYKLGVYILEDKLIYPQKTGQITDMNFEHNHTVRKMLTKYFSGDSLGTLEANKEVTKTYTTALDEAWTLENLNVVVYAVDGLGYITNVTECKAAGGSVGYRLNEID